MPRFQLRFGTRALLVICTVIAVSLAFVLGTREPIVNRAAYESIEIGMTIDEINSKVGRLGQIGTDLPMLDTTDVAHVENLPNILQTTPPPHIVKSWRGSRYQIGVMVDGQEKVLAKYYERQTGASILDRIADRLGL